MKTKRLLTKDKLIDDPCFEVIHLLKVVGTLPVNELSKGLSPRAFILLPGSLQTLDAMGCVELTIDNKYWLTNFGDQVFYINEKSRKKPVRHDFHFSVHEDYQKFDEAFDQQYRSVNAIFSLESNAKQLKKKKDRICRFCNRSEPEVSFRNKAHLFPELTGNKLIFSDFECDECNKYFGESFDESLANYLGISRTLARIRGKEGIPSFPSAGTDISAEIRQLLDDQTIVISRKDASSGTIKTDVDNGAIHAIFKRKAFTPLKVYKALLKMAISVLPVEEVKYYKHAIDFLMNRSKIMQSGYVINGYSMPFNFNLPVHALFFEKKDKLAKIPTHIVALYFGNSIFAIPVPLHDEDIKIFQKNPVISIFIYPPLFSQHTNLTNVQLAPFNEDMSSEIDVKDSEQQIILKIPKDDLDKISAFDTVTGEIKDSKFGLNEVMGLYIREANGPIDPKALFDSIKNG